MRFALLIVLFALSFNFQSNRSLAGEHGGQEHGGQEHGGDARESSEDSKDKDKSDCTTNEDGSEDCESEKNSDKKGKKKSTRDSSALPGKIKRKYSVKEIKDALMAHINENTSKNGIFSYVDKDRNFEKMNLRFVKIHDPVRHMVKKGQFFACTDFEVSGKKGQLHDLDFWLEPSQTGLKVVRSRVHKDPVKKAKKWVKVPRYTFQGEEEVTITR